MFVRHNAPGRCWDCRWYAWRKCRVCGRWVCRKHRRGSGNWFRCDRCPYSEMAAVIRAHHQQLRAEHQAEEARAARRARVRRGGVELPLVIGATSVE